MSSKSTPTHPRNRLTPSVADARRLVDNSVVAAVTATLVDGDEPVRNMAKTTLEDNFSALVSVLPSTSFSY